MTVYYCAEEPLHRSVFKIQLCDLVRPGRPLEDAGEIPAHEFHYYDSTDAGNAYLASKPLSKRSWRCIVSTGRLWAGYPHIHYGGNRKFAENFLDVCRNRRKEL